VLKTRRFGRQEPEKFTRLGLPKARNLLFPYAGLCTEIRKIANASGNPGKDSQINWKCSKSLVAFFPGLIDACLRTV
jgi:hypothetical protein